MQFIKPGINIDFIGKRKFAFAFSIILIIATFFLLIWRGGPNFGVDFSGGILIQAKLQTPQTASEIREALRSIQLQDSMIQEFGDQKQIEYLIRVKSLDIALTGLSEDVRQALAAQFG